MKDKVKKLLLNGYVLATLSLTVYILLPPYAHELAKVIFSFPATYLIPGLIVASFVIPKTRKVNLREAILVSFIASTVLAVIVTQSAKYLPNILNDENVKLAYIPILSLSVAGMVTKRKMPFSVNSVDKLLLILLLATYSSIATFFFFKPRHFTPDEALYISLASLGVEDRLHPVYPVLVVGRSEIASLLGMRFFWTGSIMAFIQLTGIESSSAYLVSSMFLVMTGLTSGLLVLSSNINSLLLPLFSFLIVVTSPLLFLYSGTGLTDAVQGFYVISACYFFIKTFQSNGRGFKVSLIPILMALFLIYLMITIRPNLIIIPGLVLSLIIIMLGRKSYKIGRKLTISFLVLTFLVIFYEAYVDFPYLLLTYFRIKDIALPEFNLIKSLASTTKPFLLISPLTHLLRGLSTVERASLEVILSQIYHMVMPENLGTVLAGATLLLPVGLLHRDLRKNSTAKLLIYIASLTLLLGFPVLLQLGGPRLTVRYFLLVQPLLITAALLLVYFIIANRVIWIAIPVIFSSTLVLLSRLYVAGLYGIHRTGYDAYFLVAQLSSLMLALGITYMFPKRIRIKFMERVREIRWKDFAFVVLALSVMIANVFFIHKPEERYYGYIDDDMGYIMEALLDKGYLEKSPMIISNFYKYMLPYMPRRTIPESTLIPPPSNVGQFLRFIRSLPDGALITISDSPLVNRYVSAKNYIENYMFIDYLPTELKEVRVTYDGLIVDLRFNKDMAAVNDNVSIKVKGGKIVDAFYDYGLELDGKDDGIDLVGINAGNEYTIEILFMVVEDTKNIKGLSPLVVERYDKGIEVGIYLDNEGRLVALANNEDGYLRYNLLTPKNSIKKGSWMHAILTVSDKFSDLYLNGFLVSSSLNNGTSIISSVEVPERVLNIGYDNDSYTNVIIDELRIYKRRMSQSEVANMYYGIKFVDRVKNVRIFKVENSYMLKYGIEPSIDILSVNLTWSNLYLRVYSAKPQKAYIYLASTTYAVMHIVELEKGINEITLPSPSMIFLRLVMLDEEGNLVHSRIHSVVVMEGMLKLMWINTLAIGFMISMLMLRSRHFMG